jgi:uncharacterized membrane protein YidH (DUF202 family)
MEGYLQRKPPRGHWDALYAANKKTFMAWCRWLTPVILTTQEAEIRRIMVRSHLGK